MCGEIAPDWEKFFKVGNKVILLEKYQDPKDTGSVIQITNLTDSEGGASCFMGYEELENVKPLETWWKRKEGKNS